MRYTHGTSNVAAGWPCRKGLWGAGVLAVRLLEARVLSRVVPLPLPFRT